MYFLEDRAQERFICPLVERVFLETCGSAVRPQHDFRSVRHGSRAMAELRTFFRELRHNFEHGRPPTVPDVILVVVDGNCKGYAQRANQVRNCSRPDNPFNDRIVVAAPDPHIERWYLMDQTALKCGIGLQRGLNLPPYKCKKDYYKNALREALKAEGVQPLRGGAEFAEDIVKELGDLDGLAGIDKGFGDFLANLRQAFRNWQNRV
jgi:hypothetical protein